MKIAVIGAGIYGITAALKIAKNNTVDLFEEKNDILMAASGVNQFRVHRGYHYPRSSETTSSLLSSVPRFKREYSEAIIEDGEHYYCIANKGSLTSKDQFIEFCKKHNLLFKETKLNILNHKNLDLCVKVQEDLIDPIKLKSICLERLKKSNIGLKFGKQARIEDLSDYDIIINCTYSKLNHVLKDLPHMQKNYQFELCEKPVVRLPKSFNNKSIVIMDGPFMCVDPYGKTGMFLIGNVVHAIHQTNIGKFPEIDEKFLPLLDNGIIKNPPITNFDKFIESASEFIPEIKKAEHVGSMYTVRTVLPYVDDTDTRPTIVEIIDDKVINIFSGKIANCVEAAEEVSAIINSKINSTNHKLF